MDIEYEATFPDIEKDDVRERLFNAGAVCKRKEFLQKRFVFAPPAGQDIPGGWLRVRDEDGLITMSLKIVNGGRIQDQKETCVTIDDFDVGVSFLESIGCQKKSYQETKRELWMLDGVEITIDEWPFLRPFVEIEGASEQIVRDVSEKIGFAYDNALFCAVATLYSRQYDVPEALLNDQTPLLMFEMDNPFLR